MAVCNSFVRLGRSGSAASGEVSKPLGLSSANRSASSYRTGISQNSWVAGEESLMVALIGRADENHG